MADEEKGYIYRVLAVLEGADGVGVGGRPTYCHLGDHRAKNPEEAMILAANKEGMPNADLGELVAIALSKWNERGIVGRTERVFEIASAPKQTPGQTAIDDPPPAEDPIKA